MAPLGNRHVGYMGRTAVLAWVPLTSSVVLTREMIDKLVQGLRESYGVPTTAGSHSYMCIHLWVLQFNLTLLCMYEYFQQNEKFAQTLTVYIDHTLALG